MKSQASNLYFGEVMHKRLRPFRHRFSYRVVSMLVDLDELPALHRRLRLFSHNRWNVFSFHDRDHGPRDGSPLRPWIEAELAKAGIDLAGGPVRLVCFPRLWGYVFNPLTVWFCYHCDGTLRAVLHEVSNTFGERHGYLVPIDSAAARPWPLRHRCAKTFYVSPFIGMQADYVFRLHEPGERLSIAIHESVPEGPLLVATLTGRRRVLNDSGLLRALAGHPLMTAKIMAGIHWEALCIWRKGGQVHSRPAPPERLVEVIPQTQEFEAAE